MDRVRKKEKAIEMRRKGYTYSEIQEKVHIPKSTLSGWFKNITFSQKERILISKSMEMKQESGAKHSSAVNTKKRKDRERETEREAKDLFQKYKFSSDFLVGIALYWSYDSKSKKTFQFSSEDPKMIALMNRWINHYLEIPKKDIKCRLVIDSKCKNDNLEEFWSKKIRIAASKFKKTIYKENSSKIKKDNEYKGSLRLEVSSIQALRIVRGWQNELIRYYSG